jgi:hypothetical protein
MMGRIGAVGNFGIIAVQYIVARSLVAFIIPDSLAMGFNRIVDAWLVIAVIIAILSLVLGRNFKLKSISSAALALALIVALGLSSLIPNAPTVPTDPMPVLPPLHPNEPVSPNPTPPIAPNNPNPSPTTPNPPATPAPAPAPSPSPFPAQPVQPRNNYFRMGEDNFPFSNSRNSFGYSSNYSIPMERFRLIFTESRASVLYDLYSPWGGSCYGFSAASSLFDKGILTPSTYQPGVNMAFRFGLPRNNRALLELLELYQISQSLTSVIQASTVNENNFSGLISAMHNADGTVKRNGLLISLRLPGGGGHAVVGYDIANRGNGVYAISIYDNNFPNDSNRTMIVDTNRRTWNYGNSYRNTTHNFRFVDTSVVYSSVQTAIAQQSSSEVSPGRPDNDMMIIAPDDVVITQDGLTLWEIESVFEITPLMNSVSTERIMWFMPDNGVVDFMAPGKADGIVLFDDYISYMIIADTALLSGSTTEGVVVESNKRFSVTVDRNDVEPIVFSGRSAETFSVVAQDGDLVFSGVGRVKVHQGNMQASVVLKSGEQMLYENIALKVITPWYVYALIGGFVLVTATAIIVWRHRAIRF